MSHHINRIRHHCDCLIKSGGKIVYIMEGFRKAGGAAASAGFSFAMKMLVQLKHLNTLILIVERDPFVLALPSQ